jgi:hypothetical protein
VLFRKIPDRQLNFYHPALGVGELAVLDALQGVPYIGGKFAGFALIWMGKKRKKPWFQNRLRV